MKWINPSLQQLVEEVKVLVDDGENIEYTRGVLEIVASFLKGDDDMCHADKAIELAKMLNISPKVISKLY